MFEFTDRTTEQYRDPFEPPFSKEELIVRIKELENTLRYIQAMAGHPIAAEGCRNILKCADEVLKRHLEL